MKHTATHTQGRFEVTSCSHFTSECVIFQSIGNPTHLMIQSGSLRDLNKRNAKKKPKNIMWELLVIIITIVIFIIIIIMIASSSSLAPLPLPRSASRCLMNTLAVAEGDFNILLFQPLARQRRSVPSAAQPSRKTRINDSLSFSFFSSIFLHSLQGGKIFRARGKGAAPRHALL